MGAGREGDPDLGEQHRLGVVTARKGGQGSGLRAQGEEQGGIGANSLADCRLCPCNLVTGADRQAATFTELEKQDSPWTPQGLPRAWRNLGRMIPYKRRLVTHAKQDDITIR